MSNKTTAASTASTHSATVSFNGVPPYLQGFVSNKTTAAAAADPLETLLYQIFVAGGWQLPIGVCAVLGVQHVCRSWHTVVGSGALCTPCWSLPFLLRASSRRVPLTLHAPCTWCAPLTLPCCSIGPCDGGQARRHPERGCSHAAVSAVPALTAATLASQSRLHCVV